MRKTLFLIAVLAGSGAVLIPSTPASAQACTHLGQQVTCLPDVTPGATSTGFKTADTTGVGGINWNDGSMTFNLCCPRFLTDFSEATSRFGLTNLASPGPSANIDDPLVGPPGGGLLAPLPGGPIVLDNLRNGTASPAEVASLIDSEIALFDALTGSPPTAPIPPVRGANSSTSLSGFAPIRTTVFTRERDPLSIFGDATTETIRNPDGSVTLITRSTQISGPYYLEETHIDSTQVRTNPDGSVTTVRQRETTLDGGAPFGTFTETSTSLTQTNPDGSTTKTVTDENGALIRTETSRTNPDGTITTTVRDPQGVTTSTITTRRTAAGVVTEERGDGLIRTIDTFSINEFADGATMTFDGSGTLIGMTPPTAGPTIVIASPGEAADRAAAALWEQELERAAKRNGDSALTGESEAPLETVFDGTTSPDASTAAPAGPPSSETAPTQPANGQAPDPSQAPENSAADLTPSGVFTPVVRTRGVTTTIDEGSGEAITVVRDEVTNRDGSTTITFTHYRPANSGGEIVATPDGSTTTQRVESNPDGSTTTTTTYSTPVTRSYTTVPNPDFPDQITVEQETYTHTFTATTTVFPDGSGRHAVSHGGVPAFTETTRINPDGSRTTTTTRPDGKVTRTTTTRTQINPDGSITTNQIWDDGRQLSKRENPDGSGASTYRDSAGGVTTTTTSVNPDGSLTRVTWDQSGKATAQTTKTENTTVFRDGSTTVTDERGNLLSEGQSVTVPGVFSDDANAVNPGTGPAVESVLNFIDSDTEKLVIP